MSFRVRLFIGFLAAVLCFAMRGCDSPGVVLSVLLIHWLHFAFLVSGAFALLSIWFAGLRRSHCVGGALVLLLPAFPSARAGPFPQVGRRAQMLLAFPVLQFVM